MIQSVRFVGTRTAALAEMAALCRAPDGNV